MVDLDHDLLAARQEIVFGEGVAMGDVAARDVLPLLAFSEGSLAI
jgi:hypothetical protein